MEKEYIAGESQRYEIGGRVFIVEPRYRKDGESMAKELGFSDMHPEIKQVMGSLRYRYSYTQNQYFH